MSDVKKIPDDPVNLQKFSEFITAFTGFPSLDALDSLLIDG